MSKVSHHAITASEREIMLRHIAHAIGSLKREKDIHLFLQQLLTPSEVIMLSRRLKVARLLIEGKTYREIRELLKVGISTIITIDQWLEKALRRYPRHRSTISANSPSTAGTKKSRRSSIRNSLLPRGKYGIEYLLINLLLE